MDRGVTVGQSGISPHDRGDAAVDCNPFVSVSCVAMVDTDVFESVCKKFCVRADPDTE